MSTSRDPLQKLCDLQQPYNVHFSPDGNYVQYITGLHEDQRKGKHKVFTIWLASLDDASPARQLTNGLYQDHSVRWSPKDSSLAFVSDRSGAGEHWAIYILSMQGFGGSEPRPLTPTDNAEEINDLAFSPDGKLIAYLSVDEKSPEKKQQEEDGDDVQVWGRHWEFARLRVVDVSSKEIRTLTPLPTDGGADKHMLMLAWSPNGEEIAILSTPTSSIEEPLLAGSSVSIVNVESGQTRTLLTIPNELYHFMWAADGKIYLSTGYPLDRNAAGQAAYAIDPYAPDPVLKHLGLGETEDVEDMTTIQHGTPGAPVLVQVQRGLFTDIRILNWDGLGETLYSTNQEIVSIDAFRYTAAQRGDGRELCLTLVASDINHPWEVFFLEIPKHAATAHDADKHLDTISKPKLVKLSNHGLPLGSQTFGHATVLQTPAKDKVLIDSIFYTPASSPLKPNSNFPSTPLPTVLLIHGGPSARHVDTFDSYFFLWAPYLLSLGYGILIPNYRGSTGHGASRSLPTNAGATGQLDYTDLLDAMSHAIDLRLADPTRLVVGGWSQGGYLSYLSAVRNTDSFARRGWGFSAIIAGAGIVDLDPLNLTADLGATYDLELSGFRAVWNTSITNIANRHASAIWGFSDAVQQHIALCSPDDASSSTAKPGQGFPALLMLHGEKDERCPTSQAYGMLRALNHATAKNSAFRVPYQLVVYPRQPHGLEEQKFWVDAGTRFGEWTQRFIGPGVAQEAAELAIR